MAANVSATVSDAKTLLGAFADAWGARFGDLEKDAVLLEDVSAVLADMGVPYAQVAEIFFALLADAATMVSDGAAAVRPWNHNFKEYGA